MKNLGMKFNFGRFVFFIVAGLVLTLIIFSIPKSLDAEELAQFNRDVKNYNVKLQILNPGDKVVTEFIVAVADDEYKKMYGLMNKENLPENFGMLFTFDKSQVVTMWMKDTLIYLDMIFVDDSDTIVSIKSKAAPKSLDIISSGTPVTKVFEINGGLSEKLGIEIGQKVKVFK